MPGILLAEYKINANYNILDIKVTHIDCLITIDICIHSHSSNNIIKRKPHKKILVKLNLTDTNTVLNQLFMNFIR